MLRAGKGREAVSVKREEERDPLGCFNLPPRRLHRLFQVLSFLHNFPLMLQTNCGGEQIMTTKELLYIEDALDHAMYFQTQCQQTAQQLQDSELKSCVQDLAQKHQQIFRSFYGLL